MKIEENTLYREIIMEHYEHPHNNQLDENLTNYKIKNPTCGDSVIIQVEFKNGMIEKINQKSIGCSLSTSSTSIMSDILVGKSTREAKYFIENYLKMVKGEPYDEDIDFEEAIAFEGVASYPARFKCATIAFEGVLKAIEDYEKIKTDKKE